MADRRKLQAEIDRTIKKVIEGRQVFQDTLTKFEQAATQTQKEKFEADLKKEIKKLQRFRDQIKTWLTSSDVKDKSSLQEYRKVIEIDMERFKVIEKETKTKAYSKEGLGLEVKKDPLQKEKEELEDWFKHIISELTLHAEKLEFDIETAMTNVKKKRGERDKTTTVETKRAKLEELRRHIDWCEMCMRCLDNDNLNLERLKNIREDIEFYASDPEYDFEITQYEELIIDPTKLESDTFNLSTRVPGQGESDSGLQDDENMTSDHHLVDELTKEFENSIGPSPLFGDLTDANLSLFGGAVRQRHKSIDDKPVLSSTAIKGTSSTSYSKAISSVQTSKSTLPNVTIASVTSTPVTLTTLSLASTINGTIVSTNSSAVMTNRTYSVLATPVSASTILPSAYVSSSATSVAPSFSTAVAHSQAGGSHVKNLLPSVSTPLLDGVSSPAVSINNTSSSVAAANVMSSVSPSLPSVSSGVSTMPHYLNNDSVSIMDMPQSLYHRNSSTQPLMNSIGLPNEVKKEAIPFNSTQNLLQSSQQAIYSSSNSYITPNVLQTSPDLNSLFQRKMTISSSNASQSDSLPPLQTTSASGFQLETSHIPSYVADQMVSRSLIGGNLIGSEKHNGNGSAFQAIISSKQDSLSSIAPSANLISKTNVHTNDFYYPNMNQTMRNPVSTLRPMSGLTTFTMSSLDACAPFRSKSLSPEQLSCAEQLLDMGYRRSTRPEDSNRARMTLLKLPPSYETKYPKEPIIGCHTDDYYSKLDASTLFFIFYYFEGSRAQHLASKALKKKSWRFHKKHLLWFQRLEEPKSIDEDYESGAYIYWDVESKTQMKHENFKFEYRYLEDSESA